MNHSHIFSTQRFTATLRRDWVMERNAWALRILAMLGVMTVIALIISWISHEINELNDIDSRIRIEQYVLAFACWMLVSLFTTLGASLFLNGYATPGQRLNQLMSPASTFEKFCSRFVICIIGVFVVTAVCWEIADGIRILVTRHIVHTWAAPHVSLIEATRTVTGKIGFGYATGFISAQAVYALGSCIWPKNSFLKTLGAMCVLQFIFGMAMGFSSAWFAESGLVGAGSLHLTLPDMQTFYVAGIIAVSIFCYAIAYMRMREDEIIQRM